MATRNINETNLTDGSPMPYGQYKSCPMEDVPVTYLHYIWHSKHSDPKIPNVKRVLDYIEKSLSALMKENEDLIWTSRNV